MSHMNRRPTVAAAVGATNGPARSEAIRDAAMRLFASHGFTATTFRMVADGAGTSIGLVQHHFGTKAELIHAVDEHAFTIISTALAAPLPDRLDESMAEIGRRLAALVAEYPSVVDYLGRALLNGNPVAVSLFDGLVGFSVERWRQLADDPTARIDLDPTWAALSPVVLVLTAVILHRHIDRHLTVPFSDPNQIHRWCSAVSALLHAGTARGQ